MTTSSPAGATSDSATSLRERELERFRELHPPGWLRRGARGWRLLCRVADAVGLGAPYYRASARLTAWACGRRWVQKRLLPHHSAMIRRYVAEVGIPPEEVEATVQRALMVDVWKRVGTLDTLLGPPGARRRRRHFSRIVRVRGEDHVDQARNGGRGVLCVLCQHALGHSIRWWFEERGIPWATVERGPVENVTNPLFYARQILQARAALSEGHAVFMAPDGLVGDRGLLVPFLGRRRLFRRGFAELALGANVQVIPVRLRLDLSGTMHIEFRAPLPSPERETEADVDRYLGSYVDYAREVWSRDAPDLNLFFMKEHVLLPEAAADRPAGGTTAEIGTSGRPPRGDRP